MLHQRPRGTSAAARDGYTGAVIIATERLDLRPAAPELLIAALAGEAALAEALGVDVPPGWPPEHLDRAVLGHALERLHDDPTAAAWGLHFFVLRAEGVLVGGGGFAGPPDRGGAVEIGYSIVAAYQRRGLASEVVRGLCRAAFEDPRVTRVLAETRASLVGSIKALERGGFSRVEGESEDGGIRFARDRGGAGADESTGTSGGG